MKYWVWVLTVFLFLLGCQSKEKKTTPSLTIRQHELNVKIEPEQHLARIVDKVSFTLARESKKIALLMNPDVQLKEVLFHGQPAEHQVKIVQQKNKGESVDTLARITIKFPEPIQQGDVVLKYALSATDPVDKAAFSHEYIAYQVKKYIGEKGVFLSPSAHWYADTEKSLAQYTVQAFIPEKFHLITQGKLLEQSVDQGMRKVVWQVNYPTDGIHLVGAHYQIQKATDHGVDIYTYFFPETQELAPRYLQACQRYIAMYEELIAPYPFSKFAVVENFFPTGYGMPSYTLLGSQVLRLPFILYTSLGHEICHNWWGNSVYVDYDTGNWCEGLTTYFADYHYKELKSPRDAMEYRRDICRDFTVYVKKDKDFPLSQFTERSESASRAIGYGKSAMVFHQLRRIIGDSLFYQTFRTFYRDNKFRIASWKDIQAAAEKTVGKSLDWFFQQWIERPGAPIIRIKDIQVQEQVVEFTLSQPQPLYRLYVPVRLVTSESDTTRYIWFEKSVQTYQFPYHGEPRLIAVDPEFDVFRKLDRNEIPPTLAEIFAHDKIIVVLPDRAPDNLTAAYQRFASMYQEGEKNVVISSPAQLSEEEARNETLLLLGTPTENSLFAQVELEPREEVKIQDGTILLNGSEVPGPDDLVVLSFRDAKNPERNIGVVALGQNGKIGRVGMLIKHYGKYSYLVFENGKNKLKGIYRVHKSPLTYTANPRKPGDAQSFR